MKPGELPEAKRIARLIIGYLNNDLSPTDKHELDEWITASTENMELFETLTDENHIGKSMEWFKELDDQVLFGKNKQKQGKHVWLGWPAVAASVILLAGLAYLIFFRMNSPVNESNTNILTQNDVVPGSFKATLITESGESIALSDTTREIHPGNNAKALQQGRQLVYVAGGESSYNILSVPANGVYKLKLADGTWVWLNSSSVLRYPTSFNGKDRQVELQGEAYFEVAANKSQPFRVLADKAVIEVLGTSFDVKNYDDEPYQSVTLISGSVNVAAHGNATKLHPGEEGTITAGEKIKVAKNEEAEEKISWTKGLFSFNKASIEEVMRTLSRWYNVQIVYETKPERQFTGNIPMKSDIRTALQMLELSGKVHLTLSGRTITVRP